MASITFDTLRFANRLKAAGVPQQHAEAEAEALSEVLETNVRDLASKIDIELLRAEMRTDLAETKADLIRWVVGVGVLQTAMIAALLIKLAPG
ncbi:MAG: hypothetical protein WC216_07480 [Gallionella sp.]|jgi:hypothetical protein